MLIEALCTVSGVLTLPLFITLHEIGHAAAAWCLRLPIWELHLGFGPVVRVTQRRRCWIYWHQFPLYFSVVYTGRPRGPVRGSMLCTLLGGPFASLFASGLSFWALISFLLLKPDPSQPFSLCFGIFLLVLFLTCGGHGLLALVPGEMHEHHQSQLVRVSADGRLILALLTDPQKSCARVRWHAWKMMALRDMYAGRQRRSLRMLRYIWRVCAPVLGAQELLWVARSTFAAGDVRLANVILEGALADPAIARHQESYLAALNFGSVLPLGDEAPELLPSAEARNAEVLRLQPDGVDALLVRGCLKYELGARDEAEAVLQQVRPRVVDSLDLALLHIYLARLAFDRGDRASMISERLQVRSDAGNPILRHQLRKLDALPADCAPSDSPPLA